MPSKSRITLFGHFSLLNLTQHPDQAEEASRCYLDHHADASHWAPNSTESPHIPFWATFTVDKVYWVGGFGDEHYIGWFSSDEWKTAWKQRRQFVFTPASNGTVRPPPTASETQGASRLSVTPSPMPDDELESKPAVPLLAFQ